MNEEFRSRVVSTWQKTVLAWDSDPTLLRECRQSIFKSKFYWDYQKQQQQQQRNVTNFSTRYFMKQFVKYFQNHVMIWCDRPTCDCRGPIDNSDDLKCTYVRTRGPVTTEEIHGHAQRVEVYQCPTCGTELTFPRYNRVAKLYSISAVPVHSDTTPLPTSTTATATTTQRLPPQRTPGRCGEYANLFGLYCRALGLETRYILDWTDHVWIEILLPMREAEENEVHSPMMTPEQEWCMCDPCEGVMDAYSMYEHGWGKSLNYCVAISSTCITDVTAKYTRQFQSTELQLRRRQITTSEYESSEVIQQVNQSILNQSGHNIKMSASDKTMIQQRYKEEQFYLQYLSQLTSWLPPSSTTTSAITHLYQMGRISGSHQWKASRQEVGRHTHDNTLTSRDATNTTTVNTTRRDNHTTIHERYRWLGRLDTAYPTSYYYYQGDHNDNHSHDPFEIYLHPSSHHNDNGNNSTTDTTGTNGIDANDIVTTIRINHVACATMATTPTQQLSVVVVDENCSTSFGCLLQSMICGTTTDLVQFLSSIPSQRIIIIVGVLKHNDHTADTDRTDEVDADDKKLKTLLGDSFNVDYVHNDGVIYIGQLLVKKQPDWSYCGSYSMTPNGMKFILSKLPPPPPPQNDGLSHVSAFATNRTTRFRLKTFPSVHAQSIAGRVPDTIMNLSEQLTAGYERKRIAFLSYFEQSQQFNVRSQRCYGYTTKNGAPIYILDSTSYPLVPCSQYPERTIKKDDWNTFLLLPSELIPDDDCGLIDDDNTNTFSELNDTDNSKESLPHFDIPIDQEFFHQELGSHLLINASSSSTQQHCGLPTNDALYNKRLIAYYFSAHWCGPCRSFTPILAEMYTTLKEAYPSHGLEIVFVSSDRDEDSFNRYFNTMPWLAIPFGHLPLCKQHLSTKYSVRGIPSMVVVDSISGQIVINNNESRTLVMQTCQGGTDESIRSMFSTHWLSKTPVESQQLLDLLSISNVEEAESNVDVVLPTVDLCSYLVRNESVEQCRRVDLLAAQLLADDESDMDEAEAYKTAKEVVLVELSMDDRYEDMKESCLDGLFERIEISDIGTEGYPATLPGVVAEQIVRNNGEEQLVSVLTTIRKYFDNCLWEPWNPKFRKFKLSFKVADGITRVNGSISLMKSLGFVIFCTTEDYVVYIPIPIDLDEMKGSITFLCQQFNVATF